MLILMRSTKRKRVCSYSTEMKTKTELFSCLLDGNKKMHHRRIFKFFSFFRSLVSKKRHLKILSFIRYTFVPMIDII